MILALAISLTFAAGPARWTTNDFLTQESASQFDISPDRKSVVWVLSKQDEEKNGARTKLMLTDVATGTEHVLTQGNDDVSQPLFSPDGKEIAFVTGRTDPRAKLPEGASPQIWAVSLSGGEPYRLSSAKRGIQQFAWRKNGELVFVAPEESSAYENYVKDRKDTSIVVEDEEHEPPIRLFDLDPHTQKVRRITRNDTWIRSLTLSHNGDWAVTQEDSSLRVGWDNDRPTQTYLTNLNTGVRKAIFAGAYVQAAGWSLDDQRLFVTCLRSQAHPPYPEAGDLQLYVLDPGSTEKEKPVDLHWERGLHTGVWPTSDGFLALLANGARWQLSRFRSEGHGYVGHPISVGTPGQASPELVSPDGRTVVFGASSASQMPQFFAATLGEGGFDKPKPLTHLNSDLASRRIARSELVRWQGARGDEVEGILYYPLDYQAGKRYPLILTIHGGPFGASTDTWSDGNIYVHNLFSKRGAFTLAPNYHGSSDCGREFAESIANGHYYDYPVEDLEKSVDALIAKGLVDPDRVSTLGWSNGAILSAALIADRPSRFKAAILGAGGIDWTADWAVCGFGRAFDDYYLGGDPVHHPELYRQLSQLSKFEQVTAPTLIFVGTADVAVPPHHSWMEFRALQAFSKAPVRFLEFPGEPHGPTRFVHRRRILEETVAWFDRYFFKMPTDENLTIKEGSPLSDLLKRRRVAHAQAGGIFGNLTAGKLVPETVEYEEIQVGRFEVTRAQYAAFDPNFRFTPGTENYPVTGISPEEATRFCQWLSSTTGMKYRLPNETEASKLYSAASGNTLDYWAGYDVNPADADLLAQKLASLGADDLLRPVGSFDAVGEDPIFDLGGNAAEWVSTAKGPEVRGGSADTPKDQNGTQRRPAAAFIGFRVVCDVRAGG